MRSEVNRRDFSKASLGVAATTALVGSARAAAPSETLRLGFIGIGNRGCQLLSAFRAQPDVKVMAVCDVYEPYLEGRTDQVDPRFANLGPRIPKPHDLPEEVDRVKDFRRIIDRKDIDAVVIATPDHWHAIQCIEACRAGKDVYCEKPLSITIHEGRKMIEEARKHDRIVQVGTHRRSSRLYAQLAEVVKSGAIGKVTVARATHTTNMTPNGIGHAPVSEPPADLDWDAWLGPRPMMPFQATIMPYKFRWWDLFSSQVGNWGVHYFDLIRWLTGERAPASVSAHGGRFAVDDDRKIPDTTEIIFEHASGMLTTFSLYESTGQTVLAQNAEVELRGTLGSVYANWRGFEIVPERGGQFQDPKPYRKPEAVKGQDGDLDQQAARDFVDSVKSRTRPNADIEEGHRSTTMAHLANIAMATRHRLDWDADAERVTNHEPANALLHYEYRKPWSLG